MFRILSLLALWSTPALAYTVTPIPIDEQCQYDAHAVTLRAAHTYVDERDAAQLQLKRTQARYARVLKLRNENDGSFSPMPGCEARRGSDLYLDADGDHKLDPQGRDLVTICETYVIDRAQAAYGAAAKAVADLDSGVEVIEGTPCTGYGEGLFRP